MGEAIGDLAARLRADLPLIGGSSRSTRSPEGRPLAYLDNAATTPKPRQVIQAVVDCYEQCTANVHRGVHSLAVEATRLYDGARADVAALIGAAPDEIVFVRGTTEATNLLAHALPLRAGDEVVFAAAEHHANWLPWRAHATPVLIDVDPAGVPRWASLDGLLTSRTRLVAVAHASNVTGCIAPVEDIVRAARARGVPVFLDAAQSLSHLPIDVNKLGVDYLAASAHKAFGPSGVGFLYARRDRMRELALFQVGGGMVASNEDMRGGPSRMTPREPPFCFEAGTPAIEAAIGFGAAIRWIRAIGLSKVREEDVRLGRYLVARLRAVPGVSVLAADVPAENRIALATFSLSRPSMTAENAARALSDMFGVCVSAGQHCAHVLHARLGLAGTLRASAHAYNTCEEIERLVDGVRALLR